MAEHRSRIMLISTGGTIEKTYVESSGTMTNERSVLDIMLASLWIGGVQIERMALMNKDSLEMSPSDHDAIADAVSVALESHDGVIIIHGTDRLTVTGERILEKYGHALTGPVVLTGAMRPFALKHTDAIQNLTESILAVQLLDPGAYCVMHGQALPFPGVRKCGETMTFVRDNPLPG